MARAAGRSIADFWLGGEEGKLHPAERKLLDACRTGSICEIGAVRPDQRSPDNCLRAGFVRFLVLGGDENAPVHEAGVHAIGAWVDDTIDLDGTKCPGRFALVCCTMHGLSAVDRSLPGLNLLKSFLEIGISADRIRTEASLLIREVQANGPIRLLGAKIRGNLDLHASCCRSSQTHNDLVALARDEADISGTVVLHKMRVAGQTRFTRAKIGGNLECDGGFFDLRTNDCLDLDGLDVKGNIFLRFGFRSIGRVKLNGAHIGGEVDCTEASFSNPARCSLSGDGVKVDGGVRLGTKFESHGELRLARAKVGLDLDFSSGTFDNPHGVALNCEGAQIGGLLIFRAIKSFNGIATLAACKVSTLVDDAKSWKLAADRLILDGLTYDRIAGDPAIVDATTRISWLKAQCADHIGGGFRPQPWEQLIKVLREMGHPNEARKVAIAKQEQERAANRFHGIRRPIHWLYGQLVGYGYKPERLGYAMVIATLGFGALFLQASTPGLTVTGVTPTLFLNAVEPKDMVKHAQLHDFDPWRYSLDAMLPIDLAYTATAHADDTRWQGRAIGWAATLETILGWIASLLLVASVTNLIKKD